MKDEKCIVAALIDPDESSGKEQGCIIVEEGSYYTMNRRQVFGPATRAECEKWVSEHCKLR